MNPCKHPIVILKDVGHKELVAILQFMYQGEVNVQQEDLATFLKTAELLQIKGLTENDSPATVCILLLCVPLMQLLFMHVCILKHILFSLSLYVING